MGVRDVELEWRRDIVCKKKGLPLRSVVKLQLGRRSFYVFRQKLTQNASGGNEAVPVALENETVRAETLIRSKRRIQLVQDGRFTIEPSTPYMDFVLPKLGFRRLWQERPIAHEAILEHSARPSCDLCEC